ncbi:MULTISPECIES: alpha-ketoglutarate-dependent dioxygenase AlkB [Pseudomonas]|uniref:alpha-ketoglutarate-dependent dioxygenase AlkB n=1 Tax=Pseudomonas TaxID=286 RepID=UPI0003B463BF|nr:MULTISPECIES: alpha-ketoglutarate-dependent dioxygenase AlkB [Pseudomonas]AZC17782.1 Alkylated DNA repair protein [Pseudomonas sp. CMR5c]ERO60662.1 2OG-Fe(II) oxygenase [Pseudomonas piscis]MCU7645952.1 alpha-ketoglutarate-dependent dioxygenase AlkB [Pseudomonas piscis]
MTPPDIDFVASFIPDPLALFEQLKASVSWDERMRARKTASFGLPYDYSQISYPAVPMPEMLERLCPAIEQLLGFRPNNCLLNFYPDGQSSMGFHSDANEQLVPGTGVVVISLGHARSMLFKHKQSGQIHEYNLGAGSLLHMSDALQTQWLHAIPKAPGAGERISLSFRQLQER